MLMKFVSKYISQILLILSAIGFTDAFYLTQKYLAKSPLECPMFGGCDTVTNSIYSNIFGVPVSGLGSIFYATIFLLALYSFLTNKKSGNILAAQLSLAGFAMTTGFVYIMVYVLQAICFYCVISAITSTSIFIVSIYYLKPQKKYFLKKIYDYLWSLSYTEIILAKLRISMGFIFLWAFIEKLPNWLAGNSPATGFLTKGTTGIFAEFFASLANYPITDYMYMFGLMLVGVALILGIEMKLAMVGGSSMMFFIYLASALPPEHNPILDEHIIYIFVLILLYKLNSGEYIGFQNRWQKLKKKIKH